MLKSASRKNPFFEVKVDHQSRIVSGYAATWDLDSGNDIIKKGAFDRTLLEQHLSAIAKFGASDVRLLWQHDIKEPIGVVLELKQDDYGLHYVSRISDTHLGNTVLTLLKDKAVNRNSFGYSTDSPRKANGVREIADLDLFEISFVTFPMNDLAYVEQVKQGRKNLGLRDIEIKSHTIESVDVDPGTILYKEFSEQAEQLKRVNTEETTMPKQVKKGAAISRATALAIVKPLTQIVQTLGNAGHNINWETGELENAGHDSRSVESETDDEMDDVAEESVQERVGSRPNPNPKTPDKPGVAPGSSTYSPTFIENPNGARIKSIHGVISKLNCAKCGTELKCEQCSADLAAYNPTALGQDPAGQKDVTGVRVAFKCATCGSAMKCNKCNSMGGEELNSAEVTNYKSYLQFKHTYSAQELRDLGKQGHAFRNEDGSYSYPIANTADLDNAIHAVGRGNASHDAIRRYITQRAKELGASNTIPEDWQADGSVNSSQKGSFRVFFYDEQELIEEETKNQLNEIKMFLKTLPKHNVTSGEQED